MNKEYILYNLKEALEQLTETINELETDKEYEGGNYAVDMKHLYHHINTAWNSQNATEDESVQCSELNFERWKGFPNDLEMNS